MFKGYKILALICARGGSKGISNKNLKSISGKPLIAWTIDVAKQCKFIDKVVVSTDSKAIASTAKKYGAEIPVMRPSKFSGDKISKLPSLRHMISWYEKNGLFFDIIIDLDPTNPLRIKEDISNALKLLINEKKADSVVSIFEPSHNPYWTMFEKKNDYLRVCKSPKEKIFCRQDLPIVYSISGNIVVSRRDTIMEKNTHSIYSKKCIGFLIPKERSIDIDDMFDFEMCEMILKKKKVEA